MKIAILNDIHAGRALEHNGTVRAASHLAEGALSQLLENINKWHAPDLVINLGDLIRSEARDVDMTRYRQALVHFRKVDCSVIHLLGNHELKCMSLEDVGNIWKEMGFHQKSYGMKQIGNMRLIWLGMECSPNNPSICRLPSGQLSWLKKELEGEATPTLVFTHCAIDDHDVNGNFFFEAFDGGDKSALFLENQRSIRSIFVESGSVRAVLQAHLHYFHSKEIQRIPYITCPAMGDNICGPHVHDNIPEIYTIVSFNNEQLTVKAFSRQYCFAGGEFS